jgi:hypothetical protein
MVKVQGNKMYYSLLFIFLTVLFVFCLATILNRYICKPISNNPANQGSIDGRAARSSAPYNRNAADSAVSLLHTGDLVLRNGIDMTSDLLRQMNQTNKTYSHCGLVIMEHGYPFVYHSIGGEDNPDARLRRDSANFFFSPCNNLRFGIARFDVNDSIKERMKKIVWAYYRQRIPFDMDFDLKTDDKLYCAEFVYKTMNRATGDSLYILPTKVLGYTFAGIDNLFINRHTTIIWQVKFK